MIKDRMEKLLGETREPRYAHPENDPKAFLYHLLSSLNFTIEQTTKVEPFVGNSMRYLDTALQEEGTEGEKVIQNAQKAAYKLAEALEGYREAGKAAAALVERKLGD